MISSSSSSILSSNRISLAAGRADDSGDDHADKYLNNDLNDDLVLQLVNPEQ